MRSGSTVKWFYPGMGIKRWLFLLAFGVLLVGAGLSLAFGVEVFSSLEERVIRPLARMAGTLPLEVALVIGVIVSLVGVGLIVVAIRQMIRSITAAILPNRVHELADIVFERRQRNRGPKIVVIGGGTGLSTLLRGLKLHTGNIVAIVTMADDGGSSGRLRSELGIPPPGDIRNTLVALADTEPLMERLFQYRFTDGEGLKGHSFGNLFIAAMSEITGDFEAAVRESSKVLAVRGKVYPSTLEGVTLRAVYQDGSVVQGESHITDPEKRIARVSLAPENPKPLPECVDAIAEADCIVLGPGSLYTSILPNLLVDGLAQAIKKSSAVKIYVCNVMTQPGETTGYSAFDHVKAIIDHVGSGLFDHVIINGTPISLESALKYEAMGARPVAVDVERCHELGLKTYVRDLINADDLVRHDPEKLAAAVMDVFHQVHGPGSWEQRILMQSLSAVRKASHV